MRAHACVSRSAVVAQNIFLDPAIVTCTVPPMESAARVLATQLQRELIGQPAAEQEPATNAGQSAPGAPPAAPCQSPAVGLDQPWADTRARSRSRSRQRVAVTWGKGNTAWFDFSNKSYYTIPTGNAIFKADVGSVTMEANTYLDPAGPPIYGHASAGKGTPPSTNTSGGEGTQSGGGHASIHGHASAGKCTACRR